MNRSVVSEAGPRTDTAAPVYAAVDLGTHNCRMLAARPDGNGGLWIVDSFSRAVRLGEGLSRNGRLGEAAIRRAVDALGVCAQRIRHHDTVRTRAIATEACRQALNGGAFVEEVRAETGLVLERLSAADEARLTLDGCRSLLDFRHRHALLFDIGGGSTEVSWIALTPGGTAQTEDMISLPFGVVPFAERFGGDVVDGSAFAAMVAAADAGLKPFAQRHPMGHPIGHSIDGQAGESQVQMLGTSGTVTTLAAVLLGLPRYHRDRVDGVTLDFEAITDAAHRLRAMDRTQRAADPCIGPDRADLVVAGCAILEAICRRWPVGRLTVADRGLREGLLLSMMAGDESGAPR